MINKNKNLLISASVVVLINIVFYSIFFKEDKYHDNDYSLNLVKYDIFLNKRNFDNLKKIENKLIFEVKATSKSNNNFFFACKANFKDNRNKSRLFIFDTLRVAIIELYSYSMPLIDNDTSTIYIDVDLNKNKTFFNLNNIEVHNYFEIEKNILKVVNQSKILYFQNTFDKQHFRLEKKEIMSISSNPKVIEKNLINTKDRGCSVKKFKSIEIN